MTTNHRSASPNSQDSREVYWFEGLPVAPDTPSDPLPQVDVAIVGSGYTGLNAALVTARAGRSTMVLDAGDPGWGCSTKNGGQISTSIKPSLEKLTARYGAAKARDIRQEGIDALNWIDNFIQSESLDCNFTRCGRYHAAHSPKHFDALQRSADILNQTEGAEAYAVPRAQQHTELGSDTYFGGMVFPHHASLDPAKYHRALLHRAIEAGVHVTGNCPVQEVSKDAGGFVLRTTKGLVRARDVMIATGGYSGPLSPWLQRRIIPIGSYVIATDPIPSSLMDELFPTDRIVNDTCKVVYYFRPSPDRSRVLFGGRVSAKETDPSVSGPKLHQDMCRIFPQLRDYGISHSWTGQVGYTFDELPHVGMHQGMYYSTGYCGTGVSLASYFGMRVGQKILGLSEGATALDGLKFPTRPFYRGTPWFLPAAVTWYRWQDQFELRQAARSR
ncbi:FAD-binding oxidoreductase [Pseudophaeobacter sp.]|uniref:NAD(P)/FAD-dependent oxidoreductase n=1 Tax=Pseudophaeobacter sp. TaxID=1971739 RepID=UPI0032992DD4